MFLKIQIKLKFLKDLHEIKAQIQKFKTKLIKNAREV